MNPVNIDANLRYPLLRYSMERYHCLPQQLSSLQYQQLMAQLQKAQLIEQRVAKHGQSEISSGQIQRAVNQLVGLFESKDDYKKARHYLHLDESLLRKGLAQMLKADAVLVEISSSVSEPSDDELMLFYQEHPEQFEQAEQVTLSHILRITDDTQEQSRLENLLPWMELLADELSQYPDRFADKALRYSECPSALNEGKLGTLTRGQLYPELEQVAFKLNESQISRPVESPMGLHILWCEAHQQSQQLSFESIREQLFEQLLTARQKQAQRQFIKKVLR